MHVGRNVVGFEGAGSQGAGQGQIKVLCIIRKE